MKQTEVAKLKATVLALQARISKLEAEIRFLKSHESLSQGMKGESLVCELTGGEATAYGDEFDVLVQGKMKFEVKFSRLRAPDGNDGGRRRWQWMRPLGWKQ